MTKTQTQKTARKTVAVAKAGKVAKVAKVKTASPAALASVTAAAFSYSRNRTAAFVAIVAAGGDCDAARKAWHVGYVAAILNNTATALTAEMTDHAAKVLSYVGHEAKTVPAGSGRRTKLQEQAYAASRTAWKVVCRKAGKPVQVNKARAPQASKVAEKDAAKVAPIVAAPVATTPHFTKPAECVAHLNLQAASLLAFANKNAKAMPLEARNIVGAFHKAMTELVKSMAEEAAKEEAKA